MGLSSSFRMTMPSALRGGLCRAALWSAAAVFAMGLSNGCGGDGSGSEATYDVTVSVLSQTDLNSVHFALHGYFNDGDWIGHGDDLDCTLLVGANLESEKFGFDPGKGTILDLRISNDASFPAPREVVRCGFRTAEEFRGITFCEDGITAVGYFCVELEDATNAAGAPTDADIAITSVEKRE
jgi:hypothetical protein